MAVEDEEAVTCVRALVRRPHGAGHHGQVVGRVDGEEEVHGLLVGAARAAAASRAMLCLYSSSVRRMAAKGASGGCPLILGRLRAAHSFFCLSRDNS